MGKTPAEERQMFTGSLTRDKLAVIVHEKMGIGIGDARRFVDVAFARMEEGIVKDGKLLLSGFGTFDVLEKKGRQGRNPKTGESATITPRKAVSFKQSKELDFTPVTKT